MHDMHECLVQDYRVSSHFITRPDLREEIRAQVIDKDRRPQWAPGSLAHADAATVATFVEPDGPDLDLARGCG